ncbi:MAG: hypothetical protein JWN66_1673 [Sphingomonas bacterium]|uniref:hypothetical protein n=1 Tax=Sphingomonas bacterium TaxID=1895847 RepID=UPI002606FFC1|nr:hypothetical protein [Sphingomonas bacterium]MDB5704557.1 hypothetical protein [Sphingomonas bacterium]
MLAYAWKSLGWFLAGVAVALGFLLVPLQVAAERKKLDRTASEIAQAHRDIRALETEFDTRANLAQLEKWNGDTLRLTAPAAGQYVPDEAALASLDVNQAGATVQNVALVVPSLPDGLTPPAATIAPTPAVAVRAAEAPVAKAAAPTMTAAVAQVRDRAVERGRSQAVALLDRKLLSDSTIGDLFSGARAEARGMR